MISSWRRTLRWLGAKPPGRSLMASRSLITQVKLRGGIPAAHFPFTVRPPLVLHSSVQTSLAGALGAGGGPHGTIVVLVDSGPTRAAACTVAATSWTLTIRAPWTMAQ